MFDKKTLELIRKVTKGGGDGCHYSKCVSCQMAKRNTFYNCEWGDSLCSRDKAAKMLKWYEEQVMELIVGDDIPKG